jgi:hypothetical protein
MKSVFKAIFYILFWWVIIGWIAIKYIAGVDKK